MKKELSMILVLALLASACGGSDGDTAKNETDSTKAAGTAAGEGDGKPAADGEVRYFDVESGMLTLNLNDGKGTQEIYFDDYGRRQAVYRNTTISGKPVRMGSITDDGWIYRFMDDSKEGTKVKADAVNMSSSTDLGSLTDEEKKKFNYKELETKTILGRETKGHMATMGNTTASVWLWKKIPLLLIMTSSGSTEPLEKLEAVKIETDVDVPEEKFNLPPGVEFTDLTHTVTPLDSSKGAGK